MSTGDGTRLGEARRLASDDAAFRYVGAAPRPWSGDPSFRIADGLASQGLKVSFATDASLIELRLLAYGNTQVEIRVDGVPATATALRLGDDWQTRVVRLELSGGTRMRQVEVFGRFMPFGGAWIPPGARVAYPTNEDALPLIAFAPGDSYTQGNGAPSPRRTYAGVAADLLGHELWTEGIGGSGWLSAGPQSPTSRITTTLGRLNKPPAVIVTALGFNDRFRDLDEVARVYDASVAMIRQAWPQARLVTLGPWTPQGATRETAAMRETLMRRAAANAVDFVDLDGIVTQENSTRYTDSDGVHPNAAGHQRLGETIAERLRAVIR